ncbi:MAG: hypothetical protein ACYDHB_07280 [Candidatus Dormibacteria bacterium]
MAQAEGDGEQAGAPAWRSCWPTADETTLSLCCPLEVGGPWLAGRALDVLRGAGEVRPDPSRQRYVTSTRRGAPLILGEPLLWHRLAVTLEACQAKGQSTGEVTLRLPPWAEMAEELAEENLWRLADDLAQELRAHCAVISDGRAIGYPDLGRPERAAADLQRSHLGVAVPRAWLGFLRSGSNPYRELPRSELSVVLE